MLKSHRFEKHHEFQLYFHDKMDEEQTKIENRQMQMHSMISWLLPETLWTKNHGLLSESLRNFLLAQLQGENHFTMKTSTEKKRKKILSAD